jgi:GTP-binding protein
MVCLSRSVKTESDLPIITIVGRPNVGKSALFNRLARRRLAIVHDEAGVTRDRLSAECRWGSFQFSLIDTGGLGSGGQTLHRQVREEAELAIAMADLILFVVDNKAGLNPLDEELGRRLRRAGKPVITVVNKVDHEHHQVADFARLGFAKLCVVSAAHSRGISDLITNIEELFPQGERRAPPELEQLEVKLAIVGRPNVGKSSLVNAILRDRRTIVSDLPGTTRDAVDVPYEEGGTRFILIDTAGIRARGKHNTSVEVFSVMRSEKSIARADLCVLVIDGTAGVTAQDKKIAGLIAEHNKPCLIAANKIDLVTAGAEKEFKNALLNEVRPELFGLPYAPIVLVSAKTGDYLPRLFRAVRKVEEQSRRTLGTGRLNRILQSAQQSHPPPTKGSKRLKIFYATQLAGNEKRAIEPPVFLLFVNQAQLLTKTYQRYLENSIRQEVEYAGLPIVFRLRERNRPGRAP